MQKPDYAILGDSIDPTEQRFYIGIAARRHTQAADALLYRLVPYSVLVQLNALKSMPSAAIYEDNRCH